MISVGAKAISIGGVWKYGIKVGRVVWKCGIKARETLVTIHCLLVLPVSGWSYIMLSKSFKCKDCNISFTEEQNCNRHAKIHEEQGFHLLIQE